MKETFKNIPGYENLYQVSNLGRVKSLPRYRGNGNGGYVSQEKIMAPRKNVGGYYVIGLKLNCKRKIYKIHQLIAMAFLDHIPSGYKFVVDHIDNNPENNCLDNLQIISHRENCSKDKKNGTSKYPGVNWHKVAKKWVAAIRINGKKIYLGSFTDENRAKIAYDFAIFQIDKLEKMYT